MHFSFLDKKILSHLHNRRILFNLDKGELAGQHKSCNKGYNAEFSQHSLYTRGDEIRKIDWRLYGKSEKLYIKEFENDINYHVTFILDTSRSMNFKREGLFEKDMYAKALISHLMYLLILQQEMVSIRKSSSKEIQKFCTIKTRHDIAGGIAYLKMIKSGGSLDIKDTFEKISREVNPSSIIVFLSDFWIDEEDLDIALKIIGKAQKIFCIHVTDPFEERIKLRKNTVFFDLEDSTSIRVNAGSIEKEYGKLYIEHLNGVKKKCVDNRASYFRISTKEYLEQSLDKIIMHFRKKYEF